MKRTKKMEKLEAEAARELSALDAAAERREAMFAAVDEVVDAMGDWLHEDMTHLGSQTHNYGRGEHLSRQLVTLVALLIEADLAAGGNGTGDANEFRARRDTEEAKS